MRKVAFLIFSVAIISGCTTFTPPRYSIATDNTIALRKIEIGDISVADFSDAETFSRGCRGGAWIAPPDGFTFAEYVRKALADELKIAGLYDDDQSPRITLSGSIDSLDFSSVPGPSGGKWNIVLTLNSSNGESMSVEEHYKFGSAFLGDVACLHTAEAFMAAVQSLIGKIVTSQHFKQLVI